MILENFNCVKFGGETSYLSFSIDTVCYQANHLTSIYAITLPSLVLWTLGMPVAALIMIRKDLQLRSKYTSGKKKPNFLSSGFKAPYWEVSNLLRKVAIIGVLVLMQVLSSHIQLLTAVIVVAVFLSFHIQS